mmetsp:Transcript_7072/g.20830  ORF Transcript_7072/g.20830 Transcript_7072/m.20830 type:complete len:430 (-) Transcript_7072:543-1832(-)
MCISFLCFVLFRFGVCIFMFVAGPPLLINLVLLGWLLRTKGRRWLAAAHWDLQSITCEVDAVRLLDAQPVGSEDGIQFWDGRELDEDVIALQLDGEGEDVEALFASVQLRTGLEVELLLVQWAGDLRRVVGVTDNSLRQDEGLLVRAHVLSAVPFSAHRVVENGQLGFAVKDWRSNVWREVGLGSDLHPRLLGVDEDIAFWHGPHGLRLSVLWPIGWSGLSADVDEFDHLVLLDGVVGVGELLELLAQFWVLDDLRPFIVVGFDQVRHAVVELFADSQGIFDDDFLQVLDWTTSVPATWQLLLPHSGTLELVGGQDVVHDVPVQVLQHGVGIDVGGEQLGVDWVGTAVSANVEVVSVLRCDHSEILALGFGAFADASGDGGLHLVRGSDSLVPVLDLDGEGHGVLDTVSAPCGADARLDGTQGLSIGMS